LEFYCRAPHLARSYGRAALCILLIVAGGGGGGGGAGDSVVRRINRNRLRAGFVWGRQARIIIA